MQVLPLKKRDNASVESCLRRFLGAYTGLSYIIPEEYARKSPPNLFDIGGVLKPKAATPKDFYARRMLGSFIDNV